MELLEEKIDEFDRTQSQEDSNSIESLVIKALKEKEKFERNPKNKQ